MACNLGYLTICKAQNFTFENNYKREALDFDLVKNLIIIPLYLNGKGPFNFILDTGVGALIITDPSLVDTLQLKDLKSTKIYGLGKGEEIDAYLTNDLNVKIKSAGIEQIPTAILKKDVFNLSSYVGKKIYGLIGFYFFNSFLVKVNYAAKRLSFYLPNVAKQKKGTQIPIEIINKRPYLTAEMQISPTKTEKVKLIIDCGAGHALSMEALDGAPFPLPPQTIRANLGVGLSGQISGSIGRIPLLKIGKYAFKNVLSGFPDFEAVAAQIGYNTKEGNLGADILRKFNIVYDYANAAIYLKPNQFYNVSFEHDMSGMEVFVDPEHTDRFFIGRIEPNSPAAKAGFLEQDEILSLDLKRIDYFSLEEVGNLLKSYNGKIVVVEVARKNKTIIKLIKLQRRV